MCQLFAGQPPETYEYVTRSIRLNGQSTSLRLERAFWGYLEQMAEEEGMTVGQFVSRLHAEVIELHGEAHNFASLLRCACLVHLDRTAHAVAAE